MRLHILLSTMLISALAMADSSITEYDKQFFIDTYAPQAIAEMNYSGIPASITLAQAILESGWGRGKVAEGANNYFCIKCNNGWQGPTFDAKDDEPGLSCFRKYETVHQSFRDHSDFLKNGQRYQPLFELETSDFKGWAIGLKTCGYATDQTYGNKLIDLIEEHGLWIFDFAISAEYLQVMETPEIPQPFEPEVHETLANDIPASPATLIEEEVANTVLSIPFYRYEKDQVEPELKFVSNEEYVTRPSGNRSIKIRPIVPYPAVYLDRAD